MRFSAVLLMFVFMSGNVFAAENTLYNSSSKSSSARSDTARAPIYNTSRSSGVSRSGPINLSRLAPQSSRNYSSSRSSNSYKFTDRSNKINKTRLAATPERVKDFNKRRLAALNKKRRDSERAATASAEDKKSTAGRSLRREVSSNDEESASGEKRKRVYYTKPSGGYEKPSRVFKF